MESKVLYIIGIAPLLIGVGMMISEHSSKNTADVQKTQDTIIEMEDPVIEYNTYEVVEEPAIPSDSELLSEDSDIAVDDEVGNPKPKAYLGAELCEGNKTITKASLMSVSRIIVKPGSAQDNTEFEVNSFTVRATVNGKEETFKSNSEAFTSAQHALMYKLKIGDTVYFEDITAEFMNGPAIGMLIDIEPFSLTIIR